MKRILFFTLLTACACAFSEPPPVSVWTDANDLQRLQSRALSSALITADSLKSRSLKLDEDRLKEILFGNNNLLSKTNSAKQPQTKIDLPLPKGGFVRVRAIPSSILSAKIALQHPEIRTWRVEGVDDPVVGELTLPQKASTDYSL